MVFIWIMCSMVVMMVLRQQAEIPAGDIPFDGSSWPRSEVIRNTRGTDSFQEGLISRETKFDLYAGYDVAGYYTDEDTLGDGYPNGVWYSPHSETYGSYQARNSTSAAVLPPYVTDTTVADFNAGTVGGCIVDAGVGDGALKLNLPSTSCVFESRIFDTGDLVDWTTLTSTETLPAGTSMVLEVRTGNADGYWTTWQASTLVPFNNFGGQYIQYRATLSTTDSGQTPVLEQVTLNYVAKQYAVLGAPTGTLSNWDHTFNWTGRSTASNYLLEVYQADDTLVLWKWYTAAQAGCAGGTACSLTPAETLALANGGYKWRVADYDSTDGYGIWTNFTSFTLNAACYTLGTAVAPALSGVVNVNTGENCTGGYTDGTVVQLTAVPNTGYVFTGWSGDAGGTSNPVSVTMDGNKSVTANMRGETLLSPSGTVTSWGNTFSWTGHAAATYYLVEVQKTDNTTSCASGTRQRRRVVRVARLARSHLRVGDAGQRGLQVARARLRCLWLWTLHALYELHVERSLLRAGDSCGAGIEWGGECQHRPELHWRLHSRHSGAIERSTEHRLCVHRLERGCEWHEQPGLGDDGREQECDCQHAR